MHDVVRVEHLVAEGEARVDAQVGGLHLRRQARPKVREALEREASDREELRADEADERSSASDSCAAARLSWRSRKTSPAT